MKKLNYILIILVSSIVLWGCDITDTDRHYFDNREPAPPTGLFTETGDNSVDIYWDENREDDVAGYNVYYSYSYDGKYTMIGSTQGTHFTDFDASNGETYYYAVAAYDYNGNESELSHDVAYDTPRPEGFDAQIYDYRRFPNTSGYDFSTFTVGPYDDDYADFFFDNDNGSFYLVVWDDSDIQDMGATRDIYDISEAPLDGWSPTKDEAAIPGHTYVIRTWDNHYAKVRLSVVTNNKIIFDWAYQPSGTAEGRRELKPVVAPTEREKLNREEMNLRLENRKNRNMNTNE